MTSAKAQRQKKKTKTWTTPTVLGLILSVVGALGVIELRPQLSASPGELLATNQPFSAPFDVTNAGYLSIRIKEVILLEHDVEFPGGNTFKDSVAGVWENIDLERGGSKTIFAYFSNMMPTKADMVIAVDYDYFGVSDRRLFRFEGLHMDNWQWSKQPIGDLKAPLNLAVDRALEQHREVIRRMKP